MTKKYTALLAALLVSAASLAAQDADEIIKTMNNKTLFDTAKVTGSLVSFDRFGEKRSEYISWSRGGSDSLIEFTNAEERGQKVLRTQGELYLFYPDAEDIIRMNGAALKQSMFGDISYEDMTAENDTLAKYKAALLPGEVLDGEPLFVVELTAVSRDVAYPRQVLKIGKEDYVLRMGQYFARSGKLLKEFKILEVKKFGDQVFLTRMVLEDKLRKNSRTEMEVVDIEVNIPLEKEFFSLRSLF